MSEKWPGYEPFDCAPGMRLAAQERVAQVHHETLTRRMAQLEERMEKLERRLWLAVYGVVAVILTQALQSILGVTP